MFQSSVEAGLRSGHVATASPRRVVAVFASDPEAAAKTIQHVRTGAAGTPIWLYTTSAVPAELAPLCDRIVVHPRAFPLLLRAYRDLFPLRTALSVGTWTGD